MSYPTLVLDAGILVGGIGVGLVTLLSLNLQDPQKKSESQPLKRNETEYNAAVLLSALWSLLVIVLIFARSRDKGELDGAGLVGYLGVGVVSVVLGVLLYALTYLKSNVLYVVSTSLVLGAVVFLLVATGMKKDYPIGHIWVMIVALLCLAAAGGILAYIDLKVAWPEELHNEMNDRSKDVIKYLTWVLGGVAVALLGLVIIMAWRNRASNQPSSNANNTLFGYQSAFQ